MYAEDVVHLKNVMRERLQNKNFIFTFAAQHEKDYEKLMEKISAYKNDMTSEELATYFETYWELLRKAQPLGDCFIALDDVYVEGTRSWIAAELEKRGRASDIEDAMIALSTPWENFETLNQEIAFYKLAITFKDTDLSSITTLTREQRAAFDNHLKNWCWIPHWYDNKAFDDAFLLDELRKAQRIDVAARYEELKNTTQNVKQQAETLLDELDTPDDMRDLIAGLRAFTFFRTRLDLHTSYALYTARPIYEDVARHLNLTFKELKSLVASEVIAFLRKERPLDEAKQLVAERKDLVIDMYDGDEQTILVGKEAEELVAKIKADMHADEALPESLTGMGASPGVAAGLARVITSVEHVHTVQEGDVLVVPSTSIDFIVAMKKSVAIVTEVGGLTSHAAIVSRELGIPCVVNTRVATKVLKSGQRVRVDGSKGTVDLV